MLLGLPNLGHPVPGVGRTHEVDDAALGNTVGDLLHHIHSRVVELWVGSRHIERCSPSHDFLRFPAFTITLVHLDAGGQPVARAIALMTDSALTRRGASD